MSVQRGVSPQHAICTKHLGAYGQTFCERERRQLVLPEEHHRLNIAAHSAIQLFIALEEFFFFFFVVRRELLGASRNYDVA